MKYDDIELSTVKFTEVEVTRECVDLFAQASGDTNPIHMDEEYAKTTRFGGCIAHGMLSAGFISRVLGNSFPGNGTIYLEQTLRFMKPVMVGETVTVIVSVIEKLPKGRLRLATSVVCNGDCVVDGEALVIAPR